MKEDGISVEIDIVKFMSYDKLCYVGEDDG